MVMQKGSYYFQTDGKWVFDSVKSLDIDTLNSTSSSFISVSVLKLWHLKINTA